ncbi:thymidine phosphorylase family protein [Erythrobacter sp. SN021]|uniref:thymidine phosphorylase family protein n=1 Tax=Erythrobacter sp. SN021 TaxID=2912574 RepID=UPI001F29FE0A|nr:thymidine phosphorylase family protein [Erythrobacter sp. SN021]MCF8882070.1 thymidine phosphorylase family protein [Erythrobacter sp. SN021]
MHSNSASPIASDAGEHHPLRARGLPIETDGEALIFIHEDCPVAKSEGFRARSRVELVANGRTLLATLYRAKNDLVAEDEVGMPFPLLDRLCLGDGDTLTVRHPQPLASLSDVRAKLYGHRLDEARLRQIVSDVAGGRFSDIEIASFIAAFAAQPTDVHETAALTKAMLAAGDRLEWPASQVVDKHCVGGLPGNRTTPIVVAIAAAAGLTMPKTSSRAITSPAGTADTMETMAPVMLDVNAMKRVVEQEGGCVAWGGSVNLSPADDVLIRIERALDIDSDAQLVASVLSKKLAAGSTHVLLDLPVGPTAKIRSADDADALAHLLKSVASECGLTVATVQTDGLYPVGRGIGPALEAHDILAVLGRKPDAPMDLRDRALALAAGIFELSGTPKDDAYALAARLLAEGVAEAKFLAICEAQGGFRDPGYAPQTLDFLAPRAGMVSGFDNRIIARIAKLAGAPQRSTAGLYLHVRPGERVKKDQPLFTIHGESRGELDYAFAYALRNNAAVQLEA